MNIKSIALNIYHNLPYNIRNSFGCYNQVHRLNTQAQWWSREQIEMWQLNRIKEMIGYAYYNTEGYRQLYDEAHVKIEDIRSLSDIQLLPFTEKSLFRDNLALFTSQCIPKRELRYLTTGGSTGMPLGFFADKKHSSAEYGFMHSAWESIGWKEEETGIILRGSYIGDNNDLLKHNDRHRYSMSSCFLSQENYRKYIDSILKTKASFLHCYPSSATDLATLIIFNHEEGVLPFRYIFLGSENLYDWQTELIKKAFPQAKLMSWYGHTERAIWAPWCEKEEKYHINPFYGYTEIIGHNNKDVQQGELGELVGSSFWMYGMPFIRYRTMDFAQKGEFGCKKCGRQFQLLEKIDGRLMEIIVGKWGRRISLTVFAGSVMHGKIFDSIKQFRFIQHEPGKLELLIVLQQSQKSNGIIDHLQEAIDAFLGDDFECEIFQVTEINRSRSGKLSYLEQHLSLDRADRLEY